MEDETMEDEFQYFLGQVKALEGSNIKHYWCVPVHRKYCAIRFRDSGYTVNDREGIFEIGIKQKHPKIEMEEEFQCFLRQVEQLNDEGVYFPFVRIFPKYPIYCADRFTELGYEVFFNRRKHILHVNPCKQPKL